VKYKNRYVFKRSEKEKFYLKLGYNLQKLNFNQEMTPMKKFEKTRLKSFILRRKLRTYLKSYLFNKAYIKNHENAFDFFINFRLEQNAIRFATKNEIWDALDEQTKHFYRDLSKKRILRYLKKYAMGWNRKLNAYFYRYRRRLKFKLRRRKYLKKKKVYRLILQHTNSNFFFILTTFKGKVVWYCTSGQVCEFYNIRRKKSHLLIKQMMQRFSKKLRFLKIKYLLISIRSLISKHIRKVMIFLDERRIRVRHVTFNKPFPHHFGQRKKKLRRI
jgi:hypothetical protein